MDEKMKRFKHGIIQFYINENKTLDDAVRNIDTFDIQKQRNKMYLNCYTYKVVGQISQFIV